MSTGPVARSGDLLTSRAGRAQFYVDAAGWRLAVEAFEAPEEVVGVALCGHAMMCDRRTLDRPRGRGLASALAAAGLQVYSFDARGHGGSGPKAAQGGRWTYQDYIERDLPAVVDWVRARHPGLRLGVVGHSLIGHAALLWLGAQPQAPVDAVVALAPNMWARQFERSRLRWLQKRGLMEAWWAISRARGYFPTRRLGMGTDDEALSYVLSLVETVRSGRCEAADGADYFATMDRVRAPVLALVGAEDRLLCHEDAARRFLAPIGDLELRMVPGADHMGLVLDEGCRPAWEAAAQWLRARLGAAPSRSS